MEDILGVKYVPLTPGGGEAQSRDGQVSIASREYYQLEII
jgi:hypothetical protein